MPSKTSTLRKNILYFLSLFNAITLPLLVILFVVCILIDIPLKHLFGFIATYVVTKSLSLIYDSKPPIPYRSLPERYLFLSLAGVNLITLVFLSLFIERYAVTAYQWYIYGSAVLIINILFFEFYYHFISRFMQTKPGNWVGRTLLLLIGAGIGITYVNTMQTTAPASVATDGTPKKTQSEVTGVISTVDPAIAAQIAAQTGSSDTVSTASTTSTTPPTSENEVTGTLTTEDSGVRVDSIESVDGQATATIKDGKIVVQVVNPDTRTESTGTIITDGWQIRSSIQKTSGGGGLQGVVISGPVALPTPGIHANYQSIILTADGASGIFFTLDGSTPSCDGKGSVDAITDKNTIIIKAISCFGGNKVRGPVSTFTYGIGGR